MFHAYMPLEEKDPPLVTVTQTAPADRADAAARPTTDEVDQLKERDSKRYIFIAEHGRGGLGRVMRTRDKDLRREVAIKEILQPGGMAEARFIREAMITARLEHPGIVPVHDAGRWADGTPFYSMKLVSGRPLKEMIQDRPTFEARLALLPHVLAVAEAVAYAHERRIIHRDLKPSNIIVGDFGETVVIDWGLAKDLNEANYLANGVIAETTVGDDDAALTVHGAVMGTPAFMPPEQAKGDEVDERADVYSLGAILYSLLAGQPPYSGLSSAHVLSAVLTTPPRPIGEIEPSVPIELAAIVSKAMARDRDKRYPTGRAFATELRRFQSGQLVEAYRYRPTDLLKKWAIRHKVRLTAAVAVLILGLVGGILAYQRVRIERDHVAAQRLRAEDALDLARERSGHLVLAQAKAAVDGDATAALAWLKRYEGTEWANVVAIAMSAVSRGVAARVVEVPGGQLLKLWPVGDDLNTLAITIDGAISLVSLSAADSRPEILIAHSEPRIALCGRRHSFVYADGAQVRLYDMQVRSSRQIGTLLGLVTSLACSPDGSWAAAASTGNDVYVLRIANGGRAAVLRGHAAPIQTLVASPDGTRLASVAQDNTLKIWTVATGMEETVGNADPSCTPLFSHSGSAIAWGDQSGHVLLLDLDSHVRRSLSAGHNAAGILAFSNDDEALAVATPERSILVWSTSDQGPLYSATTQERVGVFTFGPSGRTLIWAEMSSVHVVNLDSGQHDILGTDARVADLFATSDGTRIISAGSNGKLRSWPFPPSLLQITAQHESPVTALAFSVTGQFLASGSTDGAVQVSDVTSSTRNIVRLMGPVDGIRGLAFDSDNRHLAAASYDGAAYIWSLSFTSTGRAPVVLHGHSAPVGGVSFLGEDVVTIGNDGAIVVWNLSGTMLNRRTANGSSISRLQPLNTRQFITGDVRGDVWLWDLQSTQGQLLGSHGARIETMAISPDKKLVAVAGGDSSPITLLNIASHAVNTLGPARAKGTRIGFSPSGRFLAASSKDGVVLVHDLQSGKISRFSTGDAVSDLAFSPMEDLLVAGTTNGLIILWQPASNRQRILSVGRSAIQALRVSSDGKRIGFALASGVSGVIPVTVDMAEIPPDTPEHILFWIDHLSSIQPPPEFCLGCLKAPPLTASALAK